MLLLYGKDEAYYNKQYSKAIKGVRETRHAYKVNGVEKFVLVDIETANEVIEAGLDKRSSLDSIQQALFFHFLTGKKPVVVIYDTDGKQGAIEYRVRIVCQMIGVEYRAIKLHFKNGKFSRLTEDRYRPARPRP